MSTSVAYVTQQLTGPVPLDTADEVQSLMKKEADDADRYANHSHHQPAVPVQPVNHNCDVITFAAQLMVLTWCTMLIVVVSSVWSLLRLDWAVLMKRSCLDELKF